MHAAQGFDAARGEGVDLGRLRDVDTHRERAHAEGAHCLLGGREILLVDVGEREMHALAREGERHRAPETRGGAGDRRDLSA